MNKSTDYKSIYRGNLKKYGSCKDHLISKLSAKSIRSIFEEKFLIEPNDAIGFINKKEFKYRNSCYSIFIYVTNINFSIVLSRTGELLNILINLNTKNKIEPKNQDSSQNEFGWMPVVKVGIFEKIYRSINVDYLRGIFFDIFQLSLIDKIHLINANYYKFNKVITYKLDLYGAVEFLILTDDSNKFIDIISSKEKSEYLNIIRESLNLECFKFKTQLI